MKRRQQTKRDVKQHQLGRAPEVKFIHVIIAKRSFMMLMFTKITNGFMQVFKIYNVFVIM